MFIMTVSPEKAPDKPEYIEIEFEKGEPVAINGEKLSPANLLKTLNKIGGRHGIGRIDMVENRFVGIKSRGIYETPGGTILHIAHRALEQITLDREVMRIKDVLMPKIAELIYYGLPGAKKLRAPSMFFYIANLNLAIIAGITLQQILNLKDEKEKSKIT